jgi:hypothetical protein
LFVLLTFFVYVFRVLGGISALLRGRRLLLLLLPGGIWLLVLRWWLLLLREREQIGGILT